MSYFIISVVPIKVTRRRQFRLSAVRCRTFWTVKCTTTAASTQLKATTWDATVATDSHSGSTATNPRVRLWNFEKKGFTNNKNNNMELYYGLLLPYCQTEWGGPSPPGSISVPTSTYHLVVCLLETGSVVLVDQTTDGSIRFVTTPATCPRRYGDQPFFVAMAQEWRNAPRWLREHDDDDDILRTGWLPNKQITN